MKKFILKYAPVFLQSLAISVYNTYQYRARHGGSYKRYRKYYRGATRMSLEELVSEADLRLEAFLRHAVANSPWYKECKGGLRDFPILEKQQLVQHAGDIRTIPERKGIVSYTGGTTGASLKVVYTKEDMQERFAVLDEFRMAYGYALGKRTAWFSGKSLVRRKDLAKGNCYRDDYVNKIRFFSTFHISESNFESYWAGLTTFSPEFIVGFPSSVFDICSMAKSRGRKLDGVKVFFPTAEPVLPHHVEVIRDVLGCAVVNQYASSEGAPFILECGHGRLHIHPLTGVFEVVDDSFQPAIEGEVLVTSFSTRGTPLIRYRIGDRLRLAPEGMTCECGSHFQLVEMIFGRTADFVLSAENGRVNLGNLSNCTKGISGIVCFQIIQRRIDSIQVRVVATAEFDSDQEAAFVAALTERVGGSMAIELIRTSEVEREASGKFRFVKNLIPGLAAAVDSQDGHRESERVR